MIDEVIIPSPPCSVWVGMGDDWIGCEGSDVKCAAWQAVLNILLAFLFTKNWIFIGDCSSEMDTKISVKMGTKSKEMCPI